MQPRIQFSILNLLWMSIIAAIGFGIFRGYLLRRPEEIRTIIVLAAISFLISVLASLGFLSWHSARSRRRSGKYLFCGKLTWPTRLGGAWSAIVFIFVAIYQMWIAFDLANWVTFFNACSAGMLFAVGIAVLTSRKIYFCENGVVVFGYLMDLIDIEMTALSSQTPVHVPDDVPQYVRAKVSIRRQYSLSVMIRSDDAAELSGRWGAN